MAVGAATGLLEPTNGLGHKPCGLALYTVFYNFCKIHKTLRVSPAMEAGLSDTLKDFEWIVSLVDAAAPKPGRPKTYKKKAVS